LSVNGSTITAVLLPRVETAEHFSYTGQVSIRLTSWKDLYKLRDSTGFIWSAGRKPAL